ncbi:MAG: 30S ribosomal protein S4 [Geovibrio sp.]|nr:30S ribosomal protein S4 [Geovibrio sp.]
MARYTGAVCKLCRREGTKLYLKGERCYKDKCGIEKKRTLRTARSAQEKLSDYGMQLREKQKVKRFYGILEAQFRLYFEKAARMQGITGENLLSLLEEGLTRCLQSRFAGSRKEARQMVRHAHFLVNGRKVNIPSFIVKVGEVVEVREKSGDHGRVKECLETAEGRGVPEWLTLDKDGKKTQVVRLPERTDINYEIHEHLIVELYSK